MGCPLVATVVSHKYNFGCPLLHSRGLHFKTWWLVVYADNIVQLMTIALYTKFGKSSGFACILSHKAQPDYLCNSRASKPT